MSVLLILGFWLFYGGWEFGELGGLYVIYPFFCFLLFVCLFFLDLEKRGMSCLLDYLAYGKHLVY